MALNLCSPSSNVNRAISPQIVLFFLSEHHAANLDTVCEMSIIISEGTVIDQWSLFAIPTTNQHLWKALPNSLYPPTVDTLASSLFRPRRCTLGCTAGFFLLVISLI